MNRDITELKKEIKNLDIEIDKLEERVDYCQCHGKRVGSWANGIGSKRRKLFRLLDTYKDLTDTDYWGCFYHA